MGTIFGSLTGTTTVTSYIESAAGVFILAMFCSPLATEPWLISYTVVKLALGKFKEINALVWILTVLFILRYVYLARA